MARNPIDIANKSGFPLQIAAAHEVARLRSEQGWIILQTEHAWTNTYDRRSGFIDLLVVNRTGTIVLVIECKRPLDSSWVFLCGANEPGERRHCKAWVAAKPGGTFKHPGWRDLTLTPASPQSAYCAVPGQNADAPLLERIASTVVSATEAIAAERYASESHSDLVMYFNVILTTAKLHVVRFDPESVSLADGKIPETTAATEVPFVRFRKQLSTLLYLDPTKRPRGDRALAEARENTVFVVKAEQLRSFLAQFEVDGTAVAEFMG